MLKSTFCHLPGIGIQTEKRLWEAGITEWEQLVHATPSDVPMQAGRLRLAQQHLQESISRFQSGNAAYFAATLPHDQQWRLFPDFRNRTVYLDIETTGMGDPWDHITTIALYDGHTITCYVHDDNLLQFREDIEQHGLVVTYNGKTFDLPFIRRSLGSPMAHAHIDLRYVLRSLGYRGGLKSCEKQLGIDREELDGVDGMFAVYLWREYLQTGDRRALETLLAYNILDVVNLEALMILAYNEKLRSTPIDTAPPLDPPRQPHLPYQPHREILNRIRHGMMTTFWH
jgi:uncharacterized protein